MRKAFFNGPKNLPRLARPCARLVAVVALALSLAAPSYAGTEIVHVVAKGQTLGRIAKRYHTTVEALREVNDLTRGQRIHPGLSLVIPEKGREAEAAKKAGELKSRSAKPRAGGPAEDAKTGAKSRDRRDRKEPEPVTAGKRGDAPGSRRREPDAGAAEDALVKKPKRPGFVRMVRGSDRLETQLLTRHGRLVAAALPGLGRMLRYAPTGAKIAVDPRLATLVGMVSDHFGGRTLEVVSGFRPYTPTQHTAHSNHNLGRAMDFNIEGVPNTVLRDYCRTFRNAGVGYYPNSTFVHLDVRTAKAYWVDYSKPGEAPRYDGAGDPVNAEEAASDVREQLSPGSPSTLTEPGVPTESPDGNSDVPGGATPKSEQPGKDDPTPTPALPVPDGSSP